MLTFAAIAAAAAAASPQFYGVGAAYQMLAGREVTRAVALVSLEREPILAAGLFTTNRHVGEGSTGPRGEGAGR